MKQVALTTFAGSIGLLIVLLTLFELSKKKDPATIRQKFRRVVFLAAVILTATVSAVAYRMS